VPRVRAPVARHTAIRGAEPRVREGPCTDILADPEAGHDAAASSITRKAGRFDTYFSGGPLGRRDDRGGRARGPGCGRSRTRCSARRSAFTLRRVGLHGQEEQQEGAWTRHALHARDLGHRPGGRGAGHRDRGPDDAPGEGRPRHRQAQQLLRLLQRPRGARRHPGPDHGRRPCGRARRQSEHRPALDEHAVRHGDGRVVQPRTAAPGRRDARQRGLPHGPQRAARTGRRHRPHAAVGAGVRGLRRGSAAQRPDGLGVHRRRAVQPGAGDDQALRRQRPGEESVHDLLAGRRPHDARDLRQALRDRHPHGQARRGDVLVQQDQRRLRLRQPTATR
jgi:hypothetical protein